MGSSCAKPAAQEVCQRQVAQPSAGEVSGLDDVPDKQAAGCFSPELVPGGHAQAHQKQPLPNPSARVARLVPATTLSVTQVAELAASSQSAKMDCGGASLTPPATQAPQSAAQLAVFPSMSHRMSSNQSRTSSEDDGPDQSLISQFPQSFVVCRRHVSEGARSLDSSVLSFAERSAIGAQFDAERVVQAGPAAAAQPDDARQTTDSIGMAISNAEARRASQVDSGGAAHCLTDSDLEGTRNAQATMVRPRNG